jgi:protein TonB
MFNNLVESASHGDEMKRRGSFFLGALGIYGLMFAGIGVASVFAYDAHLERQNLELVAIMLPADDIAETPRPRVQPAKSSAPSNSQPRNAMRTSPPPSSDPTKVNMGTSITTKQAPPLPPGTTNYIIGSIDSEEIAAYNPGATGDGNGKSGNAANGGLSSNTIEPPLPPKKKEQRHIVQTSGVVNGLATYLPQPEYPQIAKAARASGTVSVQILIDESGRVLTAKAVSGHILLQNAAVRAATQAKFTPTLLSGSPVRVSGVINYNFKLQ